MFCQRNSMRAVAQTGIRQMEMIDVPEPSIKKDNDVLLKIAMVGVCGSDVHFYETGRIGSEVVEFPFIIGHECAGIVEAVGSSVTRVKVGDRVAVEPAIVCHDCDQCKQGRENTCRNLKFLACPGQVQGCLCEYIVMPEDGQIKTPDGLHIGLCVVRPTVATNYLLSASSPSAEELDYQSVMVTPFPSPHPASAMTAHFWGDFLRLEPPA